MGITISNQQASEDPPGSSERSRRRFARAAITLSATVIILVACSKQAPGPTTTLEGKTPSGSVEMRQDQAAFIGSGSVGTGVLHFQAVLRKAGFDALIRKSKGRDVLGACGQLGELVHPASLTPA